MRILIPEHLWVGALPKHNVVEMTAWGTDASSRKRMDRILNHTGGEPNCVKMPNTPQVGFQLIRSMWKDMHRVRDPRGFEILISARLVDVLIQESTIVMGMIQAPCVYGRVGGENILLNTQGEHYAQAVAATQVSQSKETWRNAKPGNTVRLRTGVTGTYMGKYQVLYNQKHSHHDPAKLPLRLTHNKLSVNNKWMHVILEDLKHNTRKMHIVQNPPLAEILNPHEMSAADAEAQVNHLMHTQGVHVNSYWWNKPMLLAAEPLSHAQLSVEVITQENTQAGVIQWFNHTSMGNRYKAHHTFGRLNTGELVKISKGMRLGPQAQPVHEPGFAQGEIRYVLKPGSGTYDVDHVQLVSASDVSEICDVQVKVDSKLGNQIAVKFE